MRKILVVCLIVILVMIGWILFNNYEEQSERNDATVIKINKKNELLAEQFIVDYLLRDDGTIRTNFSGEQEGNIALSESIGLWMEYLVEKEDSEQFERAFIAVNEHFLLDNYLITWEIVNDKQSTTNALIDDIRIVESLFRMGEKINNQQYVERAKEISTAIISFNRQNDYFVDFYDTAYEYANEEITLSYLNLTTFKYMVDYHLLPQKAFDQLFQFMKEIPLENSFFPKAYNVKKQRFIFDEEINLIDQLYTAIHLERAEIKTDLLFEWLKEEYIEKGILYGRYDRQTKRQTVDYESASVYALFILYSIEKRDIELAKALYASLQTMQIQDKDANYYGGFVSGNSTHSFDNLLSLLAERKLRDEQIINEK